MSLGKLESAMGKKDLTEQEIRSQYIRPAIGDAGWTDSMIREEYHSTAVRTTGQPRPTLCILLIKLDQKTAGPWASGSLQPIALARPQYIPEELLRIRQSAKPLFSA